ncbi:arylacetamide deacetylase [Elysia marginata]|uniref:Arylacetamide deacetylase n=1 Tax=Elysia marginata TaxID=1093978 RepID=A0AAV4HWB7_9GAST|nr:arylacetamide deacetylase [Elysia marginata]
MKDELLPALIYLHGGGWMLHNPDSYDNTVYPIANCSRKITISVDYRLSPDHPFPAPVHDCLDVTRYVLKHGKSLGIDVNRVGIAGDDTGGNIAAAAALRLSNEKSSGLPGLKFQVLMWPPLQAMDFQTPSYVDIGERISVLGRRKMVGYWALYLGLGEW